MLAWRRGVAGVRSGNQPLMMDFPGELPISVYRCASVVESCFPLFCGFRVVRGSPSSFLKSLWRGRRPMPFDEAHDQDHPAKPREEKHLLTSPCGLTPFDLGGGETGQSTHSNKIGLCGDSDDCIAAAILIEISLSQNLVARNEPSSEPCERC